MSSTSTMPIRVLLAVLVAGTAATGALVGSASGGSFAQPSARADDAHAPPDLTAFVQVQLDAGAELTTRGRAFLDAGGLQTPAGRSLIAIDGRAGFAKLLIHAKPDVGTEILTREKAAPRPVVAGASIASLRGPTRTLQARARPLGYGWADYFCNFGQIAWVTWWTGGGATNAKWFEANYFGGTQSLTSPSKYCPPSEAPCYWIGYDDPPSTWKVTAVSVWAASGPGITGSWCG